MIAIFSNNATGNLGGSITGNTLTLKTGQGALFPSPADDQYFPITVSKSNGDFEIMQCTQRSGDVLTVIRAIENTTAKTFQIGDRVSLRITAQSLSDFISKDNLDLRTYFSRACADLGMILSAGSFESGATLTASNQCLLSFNEKKIYSWTGGFNKVVTKNSTASTSGGVGSGAWVDRTDVTLRSEIPAMLSAQDLQQTARAYSLPVASGGNWVSGQVVSTGDWRVYNNEVWSPIANNTVCGAAPTFGAFYRLSVDGKIHIENCGDTSAADSTLAITQAIAVAKSKGVNEIYVSSNLTPATLKIAGAGDIFWKGSGSLGNLYGVTVDDGNVEPLNFSCKINNLPALAATATPKVVVVGDSISAYKPDALNTSQTLYELIVQKITQSFPNKSFTFYNRAIGGQTIGNFDSTSASNVDAPWYTVGTNWINYISALAPDVIVIHFGMNDSTESTLSQYISVLTKLQAFAKVPDIILCTNMTPSRENTYETFGTLDAQLNRELSAGVQRGLADFKKLNLLDFNRQFHAVRDGYDVRNSDMQNVYLNIAAPASAYASDIRTYSDFSFTMLAYTTDTAAVLAMFNRSTVNGVPFCVKTGPGYTDTVFLTNRNASDVATSTLWLKFFCGSQATGYNYDTVDTGLAIPTGAFTLNVAVRDNTLTVSFGAGDPDKVFKYEKLIRNGGWFYPKFGYWKNDATDTLIDNLFLDIGKPKKVKKLITDSELFGYYNGSAGLKYPNGGNSVNHPSSLGINAVFKSLLDRSVFFVDAPPEKLATVVPVVTFVNGFVGNAIYGTPIRGLVHPDGTITIDGQVSNSATSLTKGTVICTLPVSIRPPSERWIATANYDAATTTFNAGTVQYDPSDGTLKYMSGFTNVIGVNITFK